MNLIINGQKHHIIPLSKLDFNSFNKIIVDKEVFDLKEYISIFIDLPIDDLMNAEIRSISMEALHASIFDIDIKNAIKSTPKTFEFDNHTYYVDKMTLSTFGQNYIFDLYFEKYKAGDLNIYEISLIAIACHICKSYDMGEVDSIYKKLCKLKWVDVLPTAFFLVKKFLKKKKGSPKLWIFYMLELSRMKLLSQYRMQKHQNLVRNLFPKRFVKFSGAI